MGWRFVCLMFVIFFRLLLLLSICLPVVAALQTQSYERDFPGPWSTVRDVCPLAHYGLLLPSRRELILYDRSECSPDPCAHVVDPYWGVLTGGIAAVGHTCVGLQCDYEQLVCFNNNNNDNNFAKYGIKELYCYWKIINKAVGSWSGVSYHTACSSAFHFSCTTAIWQNEQ